MWETADDACDIMRMWAKQEPLQKKCQFCKQHKDCKYGPDPWLFYAHDEIEMVWLCSDCFALREEGKHLPDREDEV